MYSNIIVNVQESTTILNACKKVWKLIQGVTYLYSPDYSLHIYIYVCSDSPYLNKVHINTSIGA